MNQQNELELQNIPQNDQPEQTMMMSNNEDNPQSEYNFSSGSGQNGSQYYNKKYKLLDMFLLKDNNGQKSINRVCCIRIKKNWTIRRQMIVSLMVLSCSVFLLVILIVIGNLFLTRYLIRKSSEDAIHQQIQENLRNSAKEYSNAILEIFHGSSSKLEILTRIVLSAMKEDNQIFDFDYVKEFPIIGQGNYIGLDGFQDSQLGDIDSSQAAQQDYQNYNITFKYWQWGSYNQNKKLNTVNKLSKDSQKILGACDVLNYFLEDFFFDKNVTYIHYIYMVFANYDNTGQNQLPSDQQELVSIWYPGGINTQLYPQSYYSTPNDPRAYDPTQSTWYKQTLANFKNQTQQQLQNQTSQMVLTGPYLDAATKMKTLTISKAIVNQYNQFRGVASIDMLVNDLQVIIDRVRFYDTGFLMLVNQANGQILNDPYNSSDIYYIYDTSLTKFTKDQWTNIISNNVDYSEDEIIDFYNSDGVEILLMRNFIENQISGENYILIVQVPEREAYHFLYDLSDKMFQTFQTIQIITICTILFTCSIAIMCGCCYSNRIVQPLTKLTEYAKSINSNATKKSLTQDIKIDLDNIKASDKIGELIEAFKNLVKGLSGLKKGARTEMAAGNEKINFPINFYYGTKMKWRHLLEQLKNHEEKKNQGANGEQNDTANPNTANGNANNTNVTGNGKVENEKEVVNRVGQEQLFTNQPQDFRDISTNMRNNNSNIIGANSNDIKVDNILLNFQDDQKIKNGHLNNIEQIDDEYDQQIFSNKKEKSD
ncbi:cache domain protein (macronuclear) [Tetrahymena thermophila SB210]|uniref:Cache domain protein n=1 Tax=Tetrahymena thermophila (strain SB210) TaxID=312017 RepID=Q22S07_TETTS|nr:cache domain protein [Tetrahymena thermophila SB210]EAR87965.3 cache domain protein [Tetrahymena thermophila SB210]|eukprot:XP_001008210.3 cache domain protein [Tetrahymena thermophila SB210]